jgi:hypothetical protein
MTLDENGNTKQAHKVHSNDAARNDATTFNHASNANDNTDTSILPVILLSVA